MNIIATVLQNLKVACFFFLLHDMIILKVRRDGHKELTMLIYIYYLDVRPVATESRLIAKCTPNIIKTTRLRMIDKFSLYSLRILTASLNIHHNLNSNFDL